MVSQGLVLNDKTYKCEICKDVGGLFVQVTDDDNTSITFGKTYECWRDCECEKLKIAKNIMAGSEITKEFEAMTFANFITGDTNEIVVEMKTKALNYYKEFPNIEKDDKNSIALLGQAGVGKTHLLTALSNSFIKKRLKRVLYFPYVEGFDGLRNDFDKLQDKLESMKKADILFIDDLFKPVTKTDKFGERVKVPRATEWELEKMYSVINNRYMNKKPIFISSELSFDEMFMLDEALGSRIYQMCKNYFVTVDKDLALNYRLR